MKTIDQKESVKLIEEAKNLSREERLKLQKERLHALVDYVRQYSPYFKKLYAQLPDNYNLADLPPTEKNILLDNYEEWVTDPELNREKVLNYVDRDVKDTSLLLGKYTALKTSGSTGTPLPMVRDDFHNKIHGALVARRLLKGVDMNLFKPDGGKKATVIHTSPSASSYAGFLREVNAFPEYAHNYLAISVLENTDSIVNKLNEFQPDILTGYASSLTLLAVEKEKENLDIPVKLIVNSAEMLTDEAYEQLSRSFGCPVLNNYCMTEGGEIAMANGSAAMMLNEDWIIVEPVDKNMNPVKNPEDFSDGILITDLSNYVQPIIRYYVSDRVKIIPPKDEKSLPELKIDGRTFENFMLDGKMFTTVPFAVKAELWPGLLKWQAVQTDGNTIEMRGLCAPDFDPEIVLKGIASKMEEYFKENGCSNARFKFSTEPMLHNKNGGKIPRYINISE